jgi:hypothetical protein
MLIDLTQASGNVKAIVTGQVRYSVFAHVYGVGRVHSFDA